MKLRTILAFLVLIFACVIQSWFFLVGIFTNIILATLIAFAFFFDLEELLIFILFAVFIINWQPAVSVEVGMFVVIPIAAYMGQRFFALITWVALPAAIIAGFLLFYLAVAPGILITNWQGFFVDLFGGLVFGNLVAYALLYRNRSRA